MRDRLYHDVLALQGVRNAVTNYDGLVRGAEFIRLALADAGVTVESQKFHVDGFPLAFENLTARIGSPGKPLVVLGAHYDSVAVSPGAADNASGVALLLEAARHFAPLSDRVNLALVFFTLEERNPAVDQVEYLIGTRLGVMDENWKYTTPEYAAAKRDFFNHVASRKDLSYSESFRLALENTELPPLMDELFRQMYQVVKDFRKEGGYGDCFVLGSDRWVAANKQLLSDLEIALIFDEVAAAWDEPDTQFLMLPETLMSHAETFGTDLDNRVGNFIAVAAGCGGAAYLNRFRQSAREKRSLM